MAFTSASAVGGLFLGGNPEQLAGKKAHRARAGHKSEAIYSLYGALSDFKQTWH